jgi:hypothetical protein
MVTDRVEGLSTAFIIRFRTSHFSNLLHDILLTLVYITEYAMAHSVEALRLKPKGCGFDSCH